MPVYQWVGTNRKNETRKGQMEASNEAVVRSNLIRLKITPSKIKKKPKDLFENVSWLQPVVKERDIILFARQFSTPSSNVWKYFTPSRATRLLNG
jgi:type IV pilus assembly protein PilC